METDAIGKEVRTAAAIRPAPQHWRIKLYELEEQGAWIDKGTGFVHVKVVSELGGPALVIRSEENDGVIFFQSKVQTDDVYEIQGGKHKHTHNTALMRYNAGTFRPALFITL